MHWNGRSWHAISFPRLHLPTGVSVYQADVAGYSSRSAWVLLGLGKGQGVCPGAVLLHWNGRGWNRVKIGYPVTQIAGISQDGHGGIWLSVYGPKFLANLYHDRGGHWSRQLAPTESGETTQLNALSWSSGANFGWAAGEILPGDGSDQGALLKYFR